MRTPKAAAAVAKTTVNNVPGTCQLVVRGWLDAPSAGDFDGDGAADAEDGWKKEPVSARHLDRNPPEGFPVAFLGGSHDNGHRALSLGRGLLRSTDFDTATKRYSPGRVGTGTIAEVAKAMNVSYAGWSGTMDGVPIPKDKKKAVKKVDSRGAQVDVAIAALKKSKRTGDAAKLTAQALKTLNKVPVIKKK